tara:strand:- start:255 stop:755 length:501 start_codon:yes stop_codon:yes gene_type:complete
MVVWIIGLSGSGKTFLAKELYKKCKGKKILVDGDIVRKYITYKLKYTKTDRKKNSLLIADLCKFLESQGFLVICSILSIFRKHQELNRRKFEDYFQIYMDVKMSLLEKRNNKYIYLKKNVAGKKINFPKPYRSDMIIKNDFLPYNKQFIDKILKRISNVKSNIKKN